MTSVMPASSERLLLRICELMRSRSSEAQAFTGAGLFIKYLQPNKKRRKVPLPAFLMQRSISRSELALDL